VRITCPDQLSLRKTKEILMGDGERDVESTFLGHLFLMIIMIMQWNGIAEHEETRDSIQLSANLLLLIILFLSRKKNARSHTK
jgi:hypothetical protein